MDPYALDEARIVGGLSLRKETTPATIGYREVKPWVLRSAVRRQGSRSFSVGQIMMQATQL